MTEPPSLLVTDDSPMDNGWDELDGYSSSVIVKECRDTDKTAAIERQHTATM